MAKHIALKMSNAPLPTRRRSFGLNGGFDTFVIVGNHQLNAIQTALQQIFQ